MDWDRKYFKLSLESRRRGLPCLWVVWVMFTVIYAVKEDREAVNDKMRSLTPASDTVRRVVNGLTVVKGPTVPIDRN